MFGTFIHQKLSCLGGDLRHDSFIMDVEERMSFFLLHIAIFSLTANNFLTSKALTVRRCFPFPSLHKYHCITALQLPPSATLVNCILFGRNLLPNSNRDWYCQPTWYDSLPSPSQLALNTFLSLQPHRQLFKKSRYFQHGEKNTFGHFFF